MPRKKKAPRSRHRQYQTQSRSRQEERKPRLIRTWLIGGGLLVLLAILAVVFLFNRPPSENAPVRPLANIPAAERASYYSRLPDMTIDTSHDYQAIIATEKGEMLLDLFEAESPTTVNNFVFLARQGFYDGTTFHRVLEGFMAQGGDPSGTGAGGPGYAFADETDNDLVFDEPGLLAMANAGPNTNGSQFFVTFVPTPYLDGKHTIFGKILEGAEVLDMLTRRDPQANPAFAGDLIERITILEDGNSS